MKDKRKESIMTKIEEIEEQLKLLRLLVEGQEEREDHDITIGDKARITNNIRPAQEMEGTVTRYNRDTNRVTIKGRTTGKKMVRARENITKIKEFTY